MLASFHKVSAMAAVIPLICTLLIVGTALTTGPKVEQKQDAQVLLDSARKAFDEQNYVIASERYREFLAKFADHKEAPAARFRFAQSLLESPLTVIRIMELIPTRKLIVLESNYLEARSI